MTDHDARLAAFLTLLLAEFRNPGPTEPLLAGPEADPSLQLVGTVTLAGALHNIDAYRVAVGEGIQELDSPDVPDTESFHDAFTELARYACPNGQLTAVRIADAEYVLSVTPAEK